MLGLLHRGFDITDHRSHLAYHLGKQGYRTYLAGLQHEVDASKGESVYQECLTSDVPIGEHDESATLAAETFLVKKHAEPWMLSVGFFYPHRPFLSASDPASANHVHVPEHLPDNPQTRSDYAGYLSTVARAELGISRILAALKASGQEEQTIVVITTDHGIAFPEMKCTLTADGTGVTLVIAGPGVSARGTACDALVSHMDLVPTLCDLLQVPALPETHGTSLRPLLEGQATAVRESVFSEINTHVQMEPIRSVRTLDFNLIVRFAPRSVKPLGNIDNSPSKACWVETGAAATALPEWELYDLRRDPAERVNVAGLPEYADAMRTMQALLDHWMEKTHDPLRSGPLQIPAGARLVSLDTAIES